MNKEEYQKKLSELLETYSIDAVKQMVDAECRRLRVESRENELFDLSDAFLTVKNEGKPAIIQEIENEMIDVFADIFMATHVDTSVPREFLEAFPDVLIMMMRLYMREQVELPEYESFESQMRAIGSVLMMYFKSLLEVPALKDADNRSVLVALEIARQKDIKRRCELLSNIHYFE